MNRTYIHMAIWNPSTRECVNEHIHTIGSIGKYHELNQRINMYNAIPAGQFEHAKESTNEYSGVSPLRLIGQSESADNL